MKRVLIITYYFPPDGGAGTQRAAKFCKYLPDCGWLPTIVTRNVAAQRSQWDPSDASLLHDIGHPEAVVRVQPTSAEGTWVAGLPMSDAARLWLEPAYEAISRLIAERRPDVVLLTMSPFDLAFLGLRLKRDHNLPIVFDLRDPWALDGWRLYGSKRQWRTDFRVMCETLSSADGIIANTADARAAMLSSLPRLSPERVCVIPNGYDDEDFAAARPLPAGAASLEGHFCLVHTGTLHSGTLYEYEGIVGRLKRLRHYRSEPIETSGRTLFHLLRALELLRARGLPWVERIRLVLVGNVDDATRRTYEESRVRDLVVSIGYVPHDESLAWLGRADALFLPLHGLPAARRSLIVPGKTYEYLATRRPILACLPEGDAADLVAASGMAQMAPPCDAGAIAAALIRLYDASARGPARTAQFDLAPYSRRSLTQRLAGFLASVASSSSPGERCVFSQRAAGPASAGAN